MSKIEEPRPHRLTEYVPGGELVDPREYGWVPPSGPVIQVPTEDEKFKILSTVGDDYVNDNKKPPRVHRGTEPFDADAYGRQPE